MLGYNEPVTATLFQTYIKPGNAVSFRLDPESGVSATQCTAEAKITLTTNRPEEYVPVNGEVCVLKECKDDLDCGGGDVCVGAGTVYARCQSLTDCPTEHPGFRALAGDEEATLLVLTPSGVFPADDEGFAAVQLPFGFNFLNVLMVDEIIATSNGQINILNTDTNPNSGLDPIAADNHPYPRIAVAQEDIENGEIYYVDAGDFVIISWEGFDFYTNKVGGLNFQAELFPDGRIFLIWGDGNIPGDSIAAGIESPIDVLHFPVTGALFDAEGITQVWPTGQSRCFTPDGVQVDTTSA
jgi:hypothetical protein